MPEKEYCNVCDAIGGYCGMCGGSHWLLTKEELEQERAKFDKEKKMIKNLTPHAVHLETVDGQKITIQPETAPARASELIEELGTFDGVRLVRTVYGEVTGLPAPVEGTLLIVSLLVKSACAGTRTDLVSPADMIRDEAGRVVGCRALAV